MIASIIAVLLESTLNFTLFADTKEDRKADEKESMWQSMKAGIHYLKKHQIIVTIIWLALLVNFLFGAYEVGYSFILIEKLKMTSKDFGFTQGAFAIGMLLLSLYFSVRKEVKFPFLIAKRAFIGMGIILGGASLPIIIKLSNTSVFVYYIVLMFMLGAVIITINTPIQVMLQKQIEDDFKGRVFSIVETMAMALMALGMVMYGFLYDVFPAQWILLLSASIFMAVILILARPSVVRRAHPELNKVKIVSGKVVT